MSSATSLFSRKPALPYYLAIVVLVPLVYAKLFSAGYISWDDKEVLLGNTAVHQFNIKALFSNYYVGNYAPVSMLSFAVDWLLFKGAAPGQHAMSLLFHILNSILVFRLASLLLRDSWKAFLVTVIFCFHPTQVETVAWVAAKNNLVYALFFLLALISYVHYKTEGRRRDYIVTLIFFLIALLSKPSAVCFPLCLFGIDYLMGQPFSGKALLQKIPFFILALVFGIVALYTRTEDKFINEAHAFAIHERIGYAGYALVFYLGKFIAPVQLSVIYPYPAHKTVAVIVGILMLLALLALCAWLLKRRKYAVLGALFFIVSNFILVLQFVPFGEVLAADRYMYLPLVGFGLLLAHVLPFNQRQVKGLSLILILVYAPLTFVRSAVWKNSIGLYSDIISKYPESFLALNSLGGEYMLQGNTSKAYQYLNKAVSIAPGNPKGYYNRGLLHLQSRQFSDALSDLDRTIALKPTAKAHVARGNAYYELHDLSKAMADAEAALRMEARNVKAIYLLANCYDDMNQLDKALASYTDCTHLAPEEPLFLLRRGIVQGKKNDFRACLSDLDKAIALKPDFAEAYYWRGVAKVNLNQNPCADFQEAYKGGFAHAQNGISKYCR